jgi:hypothetical protein
MMKSKWKKVGAAILLAITLSSPSMMDSNVKAQSNNTNGSGCMFSQTYGCAKGGNYVCLMCDAGAVVVRPE